MSERVVQSGGPGLTNPALGPPVVVRRGTCGHEYQEGPTVRTGVPACACGLFAVGTCWKCTKPLCGRHGATLEGHFLCSQHWNDHQAQLAQARAAQEAAERAEAEERSAAALAREEADRHAYEELPEMDVGQLVEWLKGGSFGDGPGEGGTLRLPVAIGGDRMRRVLDALTPTANVLERSKKGRARLGKGSPGWRFGTHSRSRAGMYAHSTTYEPVLLLRDLSTCTAAVDDRGRIVKTFFVPIQLPQWTGDAASLRQLREYYASGVRVPATQMRERTD